MSRSDVYKVQRRGLVESNGSYKRLIGRIGLAPEDYIKFMDFLRHQRLKPAGYEWSADVSSRPSHGKTQPTPPPRIQAIRGGVLLLLIAVVGAPSSWRKQPSTE
ncbi:MAG TPA: hypothetical protein VGC13_19970 [Longimicrobium sp.]|jgi:hypothetical protein|uniref:hypothetical protein n=1 Tax=Longimicrobium sp. TaxID=2029185 RepID=UPI002ED9A409